MASKKAWIILGALLLALLGAGHASAGVAIDNAAMLDPYDPVPSIQFRHWYASCGEECGQCRDSCYHRTSCRDGCIRERCDGDCERACDDGCKRDRCDHDCGCDRDDCGDGKPTLANLPCTSGDCYESERWEHRFRDGDHISDEWLDSGKQEGTRQSHYRHHFNDNDDNDDQDGPPPR